MRKLFISATVALAALVAAPALAADIPDYPDVELIPPVDYDIGGSFYLRGSAAVNAAWAREVSEHVGADDEVFAIDGWGFGYSYGVGFGYETGTGLRVDATLDRVANYGMSTTLDSGPPLEDGVHTLNLRSTLLMANAYYDFDLGSAGLVPGDSLFAYVGGGVGLAFHDYIFTTTPPGGNQDVVGTDVSGAAAIMAGIGVDAGSVAYDIGYRGLFIDHVHNGATTYPYTIDDMFIHELRGTARYRFN